MNTINRKVICPGYDGVTCGNTVYEPTYAFDANVENPSPVWICCNCHNKTPRFLRHRKSNAAKRWEILESIRKEWAETDEQLAMMVDCGHPSGCLLAHGSAFNYHLDKLSEIRKPTNWALRYRASAAREDLANAKEFCAKYGKVAYA